MIEIDKINCTLKDSKIQLPKYETEGSVGLDLRGYYFSAPGNLSITYEIPSYGITLHAHDRVLIKTGLFLAIPEGYEAQIRPRSGLALKNGITVLNSPGTIDFDFRGEIGVILINTSNQDFVIKNGDRIAQMIFNKVEKIELNVVNKLNDTMRGTGGFGSTSMVK